jgi:hypothetical protein
MRRIFLATMVCALLFDFWFSDGLPWVAITVLAFGIVYKVAAPFLRI